MTVYGNSLVALHQHLDGQLVATAEAARHGDWAAYRTRLVAARDALLEHIDYEDRELYPLLEKLGLARAELTGLREDHAYFRERLEALHVASPQHDPEGCIGEIERLVEFQREHHKVEQAACYQHADKLDMAPPPPPRPQIVNRAEDAVDLRGLQPPEPIVRIFEALERSPGKPLRAILPHEPVPLYALLRERGFRYAGEARADGGYEVVIERA